MARKKKSEIAQKKDYGYVIVLKTGIVEKDIGQEVPTFVLVEGTDRKIGPFVWQGEPVVLIGKVILELLDSWLSDSNQQYNEDQLNILKEFINSISIPEQAKELDEPAAPPLVEEVAIDVDVEFANPMENNHEQ